MLPGVKQPPIKFGDIMVYLTLMVKHLRLIALLLAFSLLLGLTVYVYSRPVYWSRDLIEQKLLPLPITRDNVTGDSNKRNLMGSFNAPHLIERTALRFGIKMEDKYFRRKYLKKVDVISNSEGNLEVQVWSWDKNITENWAKYMLEEYLKYREEVRQRHSDLVLKDFTREMERMKGQMESWLNTQFSFKDTNQVALLEQNLRELRAVPVEMVRVKYQINELDQLEQKLTDNKFDVIEKLSILESSGWLIHLKVGSAFSMDASNPLDSMPEFANMIGLTNQMDQPQGREFVVVPGLSDIKDGGPEWIEQEKKYRKLEALKKEYSKTYLAGHPKMKALNDQIEAVKAALNLELEVGLGKVRVRKAEMAARYKDLEKKLPEYSEAQQNDARVKMNFAQLAASQLPWKSYFDGMARQLSVLEFGGDQERAYFRYAGPIEQRLDPPVSPNRLNLMVYAFIFGVGLSLGIPFVIEYLDHTIGTVESGEDALKLRALGIVPQIGPEKVPRHLTEGDVDQGLLENFRVIRTNLLLGESESKPGKVIMVASAMPQEGKTYVARNIAYSFARMGERVLLVDADIRRGSLHAVCGVASNPGLAECLQGSSKLTDCIRETKFKQVDLLPRGRYSEDVTDLFSITGFAHVLEELKSKYDRIILDTPPVLGLAETSALIPMVDGVVFVVWNGRTPLRTVRTAIDTLRGNGANFYGFVLNRLDLSATSNYYYYYYYSSSYYSNYQPVERA